MIPIDPIYINDNNIIITWTSLKIVAGFAFVAGFAVCSFIQHLKNKFEYDSIIDRDALED